MRWPWSQAERVEDPPDPDVDRAIEVGCEVRSDVLVRIREIASMTEREVLAAGEAVNRVVDVASKQIERLKTLLWSARADQGPHTSAEQLVRTREFIATVHQGLDQQTRFAEESHRQNARIADTARHVGKLTAEARLLAMNARIEASHAGRHAGAFGVIADEMRRLADEIGRANESIGALVDSGAELVPRVTANVEEMKARTDSFSTDLEENLQRLQEERGRMMDMAEEGLESSDRSIREILKSALDTLSHLQFQDPVAQGLMRIDGRMHELQIQLCETLTVDPALWSFPDPVHVEIGGDKPVDNAGSGDVLLF